MSQPTAMTERAMKAVLTTLVPKDRIRIYFNNKAVVTENIEDFLLLCKPFSDETCIIDIGKRPVHELLTVATSKVWMGLRLYEATILEGFDAEDFAKYTLDQKLLRLIEKL